MILVTQTSCVAIVLCCVFYWCSFKILYLILSLNLPSYDYKQLKTYSRPTLWPSYFYLILIYIVRIYGEFMLNL